MSEAAESMLEAGITGVGDTGNSLTETSSMDVIAAQEIINSLASENGAFIGDGGIETNVINNLADATGLSFEELSSMVENANTGTLGGQTFALNEKTVTDANLTDEVTGLGGQSNIQVTQNADGTTTLFNPTGGISGTGRTTIVEQGEDLANAIAVFDEVTTTDTSALSNEDLVTKAAEAKAADDAAKAADFVIDNKIGSDNTFTEVSDEQAAANADAIKAGEVAYTETLTNTGNSSEAEAASEAAYNASLSNSESESESESEIEGD